MESTIISLLKPMNASQIITTLSTLEASNVNLTQIDIPEVLAQLNVTQIEGLLSANSTVVDGLLQSLKPTQLVTILTNFQNVTSNFFEVAASSNSTVVAASATLQGETLVSLLMNKINNVFTIQQLLGVFSILTNGAAYGTGTKKQLKIAKELIAGFFGGQLPNSVQIPERFLSLVEGFLPAIFGDYPRTRDIAPSSIFMVIFILFSFIHAGIFVKNYRLGHKFLISLGLSLYSVFRFLGFLLRIVWAKDQLKLDVGLVSTIFIVIPTAMLPGLNLILAQRYFTWKHPNYGSNKLFTGAMYIIYAAVLAVIIMTIVAASIQTEYLLSASHFNMTKRVIEASSILIIVYSLIASILVALAFVIPPTKQDKEVLTFQPYWIKSFKWNYFITKGEAQKEAALVTNEQKHAISVINSSDYHHKSINNEKEEQGSLNHSFSIIIIVLTTLSLFIADVFRCVSTFIHQYEAEHSWIFDPVVMYVLFGVLEVFVNVLYVVGRIDLRFFRPDRLVTVSLKASSEEVSNESNEEKSIEEKSNEETV